MRKTLLISAFLAITLLGAGCKKGPTLVGKWSGGSGAQTFDFDFKDDNTFTLGTKVGPYTVTAKGDYKLDGEKLGVTTKDIAVPGAPPAAIARAKASPNFGKPQEMTAKFISDDELSLAGGVPGPAGAGKTTPAMTLKRVKEGS